MVQVSKGKLVIVLLALIPVVAWVCVKVTAKSNPDIARQLPPIPAAPITPLDHEAITCSVCHSITEARLDGTGSSTIRRPALLAKGDGRFITEML